MTQLTLPGDTATRRALRERLHSRLAAIPQYLDAPGKTRDALPWHDELAPAAGIDTETGERDPR